VIVCLCEAMNDRAIREAIRDGSETLRELRRNTGAGSQCGSCTHDLKKMIAEWQEDRVAERLAAK